MVARSRDEQAPDLAARLDRLARLRSVVADHEERFRQAISADFGHRSAVETTIAETMLVFSEIRHAARHLKSWMAPMREEIFGPVLPVLGTRSAAEAIAFVNRRDRPLALYWFGKDRDARDEVLARTISGGVTINDCLFHFTQVNQPMGGVGAPGTGACHGEWGFRTFSKLKPVFYRSKFNRLADFYPPYGGKIARLEKLMRFMS